MKFLFRFFPEKGKEKKGKEVFVKRNLKENKKNVNKK
jgi:hypothetical protein